MTGRLDEQQCLSISHRLRSMIRPRSIGKDVLTEARLETIAIAIGELVRAGGGATPAES